MSKENILFIVGIIVVILFGSALFYTYGTWMNKTWNKQQVLELHE